MNFFKKYLGLVIGGAVALVLIILTAFMLFRFSGDYNRVQADLQSNDIRLKRLHERNPLPSQENVEMVAENLTELEEYLASLLGKLSASQPEPEQMERAAFPAEIERSTRRLRALASEHDVRIADGVAYGFQRYAAGNLPMQEHVTRLLVQLRTIELLCGKLITAPISELSGVEREVFDVERTQQEAGAAATGRRRGAAVADVVAAPTRTIQPQGVEGLYTRERYTLTFWASDEALREVLNAFASSPVMIVVRNVELRNEMGLGGTTAAARLSTRLQPRETGGRAGPGAGRGDLRDAAAREGVPGQPLFREDRVVAGRERVQVTIQLDVYRFEHGEDDAV